MKNKNFPILVTVTLISFLAGYAFKFFIDSRGTPSTFTQTKVDNAHLLSVAYRSSTTLCRPEAAYIHDSYFDLSYNNITNLKNSYDKLKSQFSTNEMTNCRIYFGLENNEVKLMVVGLNSSSDELINISNPVSILGDAIYCPRNCDITKIAKSQIYGPNPCK